MMSSIKRPTLNKQAQQQTSTYEQTQIYTSVFLVHIKYFST